MRDFTFCPVCASPLAAAKNDQQTCPNCGTTHYHKAKPCVAVIVVQNNQVLLSRRAIDPFRGKWDVLGGFIEPFETAEEGAVREVREEAGLEVEIEIYLGSFLDHYGTTDEVTLNLVFASHVVAGKQDPRDDVAELHWVDPKSLPPPDHFAFTNTVRALNAWLDFRENQRSTRKR
jgi:NAD+ diphosphatase